MKIFILLLYFIVMLAIGLASHRRSRDVGGFFLGHRSIGPWISAFAYGTTYFSAVIFIGYAGKVGWGFGLSSLWIALGNALIGSFLAWKFLARPTRVMTARLNALTLPEFLAARYDSPALKTASALLIFIFLVPYSASVYLGLSYLFEQVFHLDFNLALMLMAGLTAIYLVLGGYIAVTWTDFIQGLVMLGGVSLLVYYVVTAPPIGGLVQGIKALKDIHPQLVSPLGPNWVSLLSLVVLTSLGPWGLPQMLQKFYAIKDEKAIRPATIVSTLFALIIAGGAYFTGSFGRLFFNNQMPLLNGRPNPDLIMPLIIERFLPPGIGIVILLLVLAASMSTLSSLVLVSSSAVAIDLLQGAWPKISKRTVLLCLRFFCVLFIVLSVYIALKPTIILVLMSLSWGTVAGGFLAPYLYGLYWRRTTKAGAWAGFITGVALSLGLSFYYRLDSTIIPTIGSLAMLLPLAVVPVVSLFTPAFSPEHLKHVFGEESPGLLRDLRGWTRETERVTG
ncbi:solute:Na+ symporter, SSS family [Thermanaeromonas toyohensis ToBE]|uniref:Solute:Na+ symporter, SSS family n=1 Tax=Thermanaeromonas toyohensis ToBE TaxID=698762 RepID=A0A1W1VB25_9FIRM|nr:sodium:solute symporter [Thermanaeromonas toyohensis]SMB90486.1 solute:Na+ symporter, SSS family [Thermanaeromonas toyohensis ToBE]